MGLVTDDLFAWPVDAERMRLSSTLPGASFLACAIDTDEYESRRDAFLPPTCDDLLRDFRGLFLTALTKDAEPRRKLRPLLDVVSRLG